MKACTYFLLALCLLPLIHAQVKKVVYVDDGNWDSPQTTIINAANAGFNYIILAFYMHTGPSDFLQAWQGLDDGTKSSTIQTLHSMGSNLMVSYGGGADGDPYVVDSYDAGVEVGKFAKAQMLDGIDFDLENFDQGFTVNGQDSNWTIQWCQNITRGAAAGFGPGAILTHAPQSPYFGPIGSQDTWAGPSGGYTAVYNGIKDILSFFNLQFYNQGSGCYNTYDSLFLDGNGNNCGLPGTSVQEIYNAGIPYEVIVIGKPVHQNDAGDGYVDPDTLHSWFVTANNSLGWDSGIMGWEWTDDGSAANWIQSIYP